MKARRDTLTKQLAKPVATLQSATTPARDLKKMRAEHTGETPATPTPVDRSPVETAGTPSKALPTPKKARCNLIWGMLLGSFRK